MSCDSGISTAVALCGTRFAFVIKTGSSRIGRAGAYANVFFVSARLGVFRSRLSMLDKDSIAKIKRRASLLMLRSQSTDGFFRYGGCSVTRGCTLFNVPHCG